MRNTRAVSNIIGTVLLIVITIALAVGIYFLAHRYMTVSSNPLSVSADLVGQEYYNGSYVATLAVTVTNSGSTPITLSSMTVYLYEGASATTPNSTSISPPVSGFTLAPHTGATFTVIVESIPTSTGTGIAVAVQGTLPNGASVSATSPTVSLQST